MMILVGGEKGGSGKSCLAQNLAVYFIRRTEDNYVARHSPQFTEYLESVQDH